MMKVFEILNADVQPISESQIIDRLKKFNWKYEFSENSTVVRRCQRELELLENQIYKMWKSNPQKAVNIWNSYSGEGSSDLSVTPSFIFRLQAQDR